MFCVHILPPALTTDYKMFNMTLCDSLHYGDAFGAFVCLKYGDIERLQLTVLSCCPVPFLGIPVFLKTVVYMFLDLYRSLCSTSAFCIASSSCSAFRIM